MTWISYRNQIAAATIEATREIASMPASRLKNPTVAERYRAAGLSPGDTATTVKFALPAAARPSVIFWQRPRRSAAEEETVAPSFAATDTVRHRFSTTAAHDGDVYDSGAAASNVATGRGVHAFFPPAGAPAPFYAMTFDALSRATAPDNYVDWGFAHYGLFDVEPQIDYAAPAVFGWDEGAERRFSWDRAAMVIRRKQRRRRWRLVFRSVKWLSERAALDAFLEYAGDGGRFILGLDKTGPGDVVMAVLDQAAMSRTSRKFGALELPVLEAF